MQTKPAKFQIFILIAALFVVVSIGGACSSGAGDTSVKAAEEKAPGGQADADLSSALQFIEKMPDAAHGYTRLAAVYIKKARATGDFDLNSKAETAVSRALEIEPRDPTAKKLRASLDLTFHRFPEALELGLRLEKELPGDAFVYGVLTDAHVELGNYKEAVETAQKMVDLKPNTASYARVSHLRSLHGDAPGAIEMMTLAARSADPADKEAQSWCLVQLGREYFKTGDYARAEKIYDEALQNFPNYHAALAEKGIVRAALGDRETAVRFLSDAQNRVPSVEAIIALGDIFARGGETEKARRQYDLAEAVEQKLGGTDLRRLALLWADQGTKLDEALKIAERERAVRADVFTADVLAWCLYKNGRFVEAKAAVAEAMRLKTKDARLFYHAGMIEKSLGNKKEAAGFLRLALKTSPAFDFLQAEKAAAALEELK